MKDRLKLVRKDTGLTIQGFADDIGVSKSNIESYEYGRRNPSDAFIKLICNKYHVNYEWLVNGNGEMYKKSSNESMVLIDALMTGDNEFAKNLFKNLASQDAEFWKKLEEIFNTILEDEIQRRMDKKEEQVD